MRSPTNAFGHPLTFGIFVYARGVNILRLLSSQSLSNHQSPSSSQSLSSSLQMLTRTGRTLKCDSQRLVRGSPTRPVQT